MSEPVSHVPAPDHAVVLLHGILLNRWFLKPLETRARQKGWRTLNLTYPSTRRTIEGCADFGAGRIERAAAREPIRSVDFVTHSLGGLVARRLIREGRVPPARHLVQLVPPNRGSAVARHWRRRWLYRGLYGSGAGWQLGEEPEEIDRICGIPEEVAWGIVTGTVRTRVRPALLPPPHDGVVSHREMLMPHRELPTCDIRWYHTPLQFSRRASAQVLHFLAHARCPPHAR
ncbi:MAG: esterase/lipase family protein [Planctomycetota bacterium]